ncbi:HipA family kinase [Roseovarius spongiae]|uniref:HipA family kinase n=1 Tax=Roseovarius spongiae TaxID=2320272 RepID=UPI0014089462|nr:HipA family kinase [Roseovarius spongiae]
MLGTSTKPLVVETDVGTALCKYCGNPAGTDALCSELIASELLALLSYDAPAHALVRLSKRFDLQEFGVHVEDGTAFLTRWEPLAITFSGEGGLLDSVSNPEMVSKVLVFDTWIKNVDRFVSSPGLSTENLDNLLFVPDNKRVRMMVIDHSHSFTETTFEDGFSDDWWDDEDVCGTHQSLATFVREDALHQGLDEISAVSREQLERIVGLVPPEWGLSQRARVRLVDGLLNRAGEMKHWLPRKLLREPPLGYELGKR